MKKEYGENYISIQICLYMEKSTSIDRIYVNICELSKYCNDFRLPENKPKHCKLSNEKHIPGMSGGDIIFS